MSVWARELSPPPQGASGLTSLLKYKLRGPGLDFKVSFSEHMDLQLAQDLFLMWVGLCGLATLRSCRMQRGMWAQSPALSMTSLLKRLPRKSANARILRLHICFQKVSVSIFRGTTNQNVLMCLSQGKHQIPNCAVGVHGPV